jgi:GGDEF domain-containing protein
MIAMSQSAIPHVTNPISPFVTASFGGCVFESHIKTAMDSIYKFSDNLLYEVKKNGKNNLKITEFH